VALLFLREALPPDVAAPDGLPITRLCFFIAPSPRTHLDLLARLSRSLVRGPLRELIIKDATDDELFNAIEAVDATAADAAKSGGKS